jgi:hypothetical protein
MVAQRRRTVLNCAAAKGFEIKLQANSHPAVRRLSAGRILDVDRFREEQTSPGNLLVAAAAATLGKTIEFAALKRLLGLRAGP